MNSLGDLIRAQAARLGDKPALVYQDRTSSYRDLDERSSRVAQGLLHEGVGPQEHIAFLDKNTPEYFEVLLGGGKVNAINVAVNWRLAPREMAYVINDAEAKVLFVGPDFEKQLEEIRPELTTVKKVVMLGPDYDAWVSSFPVEDPRIPSVGDDVCLQLYTSGTTGLPKGAMLTNDNFFPMLSSMTPHWFFDESSLNIVVMPLFHIAGCGWAIVGLHTGCTSIMLREVNPAEIVQVMQQHKVTNAIFVPAVLQFLLATPGLDDCDFSALRCIVYGASPITEDVLVRSMQTFGCKFVQAYGLTETTGGVTMLAAEDHDPGGPRANLLRSAGKPLPWVEMRIVDPETGSDCAQGVVGELWFRTRQNMKGYWRLPEETAKSLTPDGWFKTGDAGYTDEEGYVYIHDRVKDMIISGGENIYPAEVENVLMSHASVADVAVIGVPSERWGETVKAIVVRAPDAGEPDPDLAQNIIAFTRERLAHYKCPTSVDFAEALPRNPSGKILKRELREPFWVGQERRVH